MSSLLSTYAATSVDSGPFFNAGGVPVNVICRSGSQTFDESVSTPTNAAAASRPKTCSARRNGSVARA